MPRRAQLRCVVIRRDGRAVLIWPFVVHRKKGLWKEARPLGAMLTEYSEPLALAEAEAEAERLTARALDALRGHTDLVLLPLVPGGSILDRLLSARPEFRRLFALPTKRLEFDHAGPGKAFCDSLPGTARRELGRRRRRLMELGVVQFELCVPPSCRESVIDWMLERKRQWLSDTGRSSPWLGTESYRHRLIAAAGLPYDPPQLLLSTLTLNGRILSAKASRLDRHRLEFLVTTFDTEFQRLSPSQLLLGELLEWACARGLDADFRLGDESYKDLWANRHDHCATYAAAASTWGRVFFKSKAVVAAFRAR